MPSRQNFLNARGEIGSSFFFAEWNCGTAERNTTEPACSLSQLKSLKQFVVFCFNVFFVCPVSFNVVFVLNSIVSEIQLR